MRTENRDLENISQRYIPYEIVINDIEPAAQSVKKHCPIHGTWTFVRIAGNRFACAHSDHTGQSSQGSESGRMHDDVYDR